MTAAKALWAPLEVTDFDAAARFYGTLLGLPCRYRWQRGAERGALFGAGPGGVIEIVGPGAGAGPPPVALEVATWSEVDALAERLVGAPKVLPRGHYGFVARDPDGHALLIWSEA